MVLGKKGDVSVDDVTRLSRSTKFPDGPRVPGIERLFAGACEESGEERLAGAVSPGLGDASGGGDDPVFATPGGFDESCDTPVAPFEGDQGAGVKNERHSGGTPAPASRLFADGLLARSRSAEESVGVGNFIVGEIAVLFFPRPHRFAEGLETEPVTSGFGQPGRHALVAVRR